MSTEMNDYLASYFGDIKEQIKVFSFDKSHIFYIIKNKKEESLTSFLFDINFDDTFCLIYTDNELYTKCIISKSTFEDCREKQNFYIKHAMMNTMFYKLCKCGHKNFDLTNEECVRENCYEQLKNIKEKNIIEYKKEKKISLGLRV